MSELGRRRKEHDREKFGQMSDQKKRVQLQPGLHALLPADQPPAVKDLHQEYGNPDWKVTVEKVADAAMDAWHSYEDWHCVAKAMLELLGDNDAHRRIFGLRDRLKNLGIEHDEVSKENVRLRLGFVSLEGQLLDAQNEVVFLTQRLAKWEAVAP